MSDSPSLRNILVTGGTGFVGRHVVRELLARGLTPVCLVRDARKLFAQHPQVKAERLVPMVGSLDDRRVLIEAASQCQAAIHLVGIIIARRLQGQTFQKVHVAGTKNVVNAVRDAGVRRYLHMSALGTRPDAVAKYHQTKWQAEAYVRASGLEWTIFRPSLIHGPDGEFMRLIRKFVCGLNPPVIPYFGDGSGKLQPVHVKDVAHCFVESLFRRETVGREIPLGGPRVYTWIQLYNVCRTLIPCARRWKPIKSLPVPLAKMMAAVLHPPLALAELAAPSLGLLRFDGGQVDMAQEESTCDHTEAEKLFDMRMRDFEAELTAYADDIR